MASNKKTGDIGEGEVVKFIPCPNCGKRLMRLPEGYPLYDVQCTGCVFRAQVKTNNTKPKGVVFGAGWQIMDKVLKSGFISPPLFLNFKWVEEGRARQEIHFYPFIPKRCLRKYKLSPTARRANYLMFRYEGLNKIPHFILYSSLVM